MSPTAESNEQPLTATSSPSEEEPPSVVPMMRPLDPREQRAHATLSKIEYWMDNSIPLPFTKGKHRIGLDPIIGIIPLVGDFGSALVSLAFVARAAPTLSRYTVLRMLYNVWIDSVIGVVPLLGDIFDIGHKANKKNLKLFEEHMAVGAELRDQVDKRWLGRVVFLFFLFCAATTIIMLALFILLVLYLTGHL